MEFHIETERLLLREFRESDLEAFFEMDSNIEVHRYLGNNPTKTIEQAFETLKFIQQQYIDNGIGRWAAIEKSSCNFIGWSGLKFIREYENNHIHFYDVGYRFMPKYWGKGYARESGKVALKFGFETLGLNEIIGTCHEENIASRKALENCGLTFVEKFVYKNQLPCDWLKITKEQWNDHNRIK